MNTTIPLTDIFTRWQMSFQTVNLFDVGQQRQFSNEELVQKIQKGEKILFEDLVERFSQKIFRYLFFYFNFSRDTAEDVVQDVFVKLWEKLNKYDSKQKFEPWLYRFVHNYTIDWLRKNQKDLSVKAFSQMMPDKNENSCTNFEDLFVVEDSKVDVEVNKKIKKEILQGIIENLDLKYRDIVVLFYFEQKSYEEIAYILQTNVNNVGTMLSRAKQKIKQIIEADPKLGLAVEFDI